MIHQFIFANPRPGMSVADFQDYWIQVHAVKYAAKIPQIRKYKVSRILAAGGEEPAYRGMAEIWLENEKEQIASLQSTEFIHGARADEPNWAAFWQSLCIDTYSTEMGRCDALPKIKLVVLAKRRGGIPLSVFRAHAAGRVASGLLSLPGVRQVEYGEVKDSAYAFGESVTDIVLQAWFEDVGPLRDALAGARFAVVAGELDALCPEKYVHRFVCEETSILA